MIDHFVIREQRYNIAVEIVQSLLRLNIQATLGSGSIAVHVAGESEKRAADALCAQYAQRLVRLVETPDEQKGIGRKKIIRRPSW